MRRLLALLSLLASLALAGEATAAEVVLADDEGRPIRFDVRVEGVDTEWYAALLRAAPHGDEIATLRIDVVSVDELQSICGRGAGGCYSRDVMVVPAGRDAQVAHTFLHEYGHHVDRSRPVDGVPEPNGAPEWWRARGMAELVRLGPAPAPTATPPALKPVSIERRGTLAGRRRVAIPFGLLGPGRSVRATATIAARATLEICCNGARVALKTLSAATRTVTIDRRNLGPAECTATLTNTGAAPRAFSLLVRLTIAGSA